MIVVNKNNAMAILMNNATRLKCCNEQLGIMTENTGTENVEINIMIVQTPLSQKK